MGKVLLSWHLKGIHYLICEYVGVVMKRRVGLWGSIYGHEVVEVTDTISQIISIHLCNQE